MAEASRDWPLRLLCGPCKWAGALGVPLLRDRPLAANASAAQPTRPAHVGSYDEARGRLAPSTPYPPSLATTALRRHPPEVGARCLNWARRDLCGGRPVTGVPTANGSIETSC